MSGNVDEETWWQQAACNGMDTSVFYPGDRERGPTLARRERRAKQICASCPVIANCLQWALDAREPYGVWGGKSAKERARMLSAMTGIRASRAFSEPGHDRADPQHVVRPGDVRQRDEPGTATPLGEQPVAPDVVRLHVGLVAAGGRSAS